MKCRCGHSKLDHVRGGGCRTFKRIVFFRDNKEQSELVQCECDQYDARKLPPNQALVRNRIEPGGLEDDYK